jgi:hypothetical protein
VLWVVEQTKKTDTVEADGMLADVMKGHQDWGRGARGDVAFQG